MFDFLKTQYNIQYDSIFKLSKKTYKIKTNKECFILKEVSDKSVNQIYERLSIAHISEFVLPLLGKDHQYIHAEENHYYILEPYFEGESIFGYDLKLGFYITGLVHLHQKSYYVIPSDDHYLESTLNYLDSEIKKVSDAIQSRIEVVEHSDYHSPNDWYFLLHYSQLNDALEAASKHVLNFENLVKDEKELRICLTYQNFDFNHIFLKHQKIVSIENMAYNILGYDLYQLVKALELRSIRLTPYIQDYLTKNPLKEYEKEYLLALLYLIDYHRYETIKEDLQHLMHIVHYLEKVNALENEVIFSSKQEE